MTVDTVYIYVRSLSGDLGGPLFSSLDLFRLLDEHVDARVLSIASRERNSTRLDELAIPPEKYCSMRDFLFGVRGNGAVALHLQHVLYPSTALLLNYAKARGLITVMSPRGALDEWSMSQKSWKKRVAKFALGRTAWRRADVFHCTASAESAQVQALLPGVRTMVAPNVISSLWRAGECVPEERPSALYLSRLHEKKRPDLAITGLANLLHSGELSSLTIAGPGSPQIRSELEDLVFRENLVGQVEFVGELNEAQCAEAYESHEVFVLPTSQENFGRVLFEALGSGMAVFVPDHVDTWPELERLGAISIEQTANSIDREISEYLSNSVRKRTTQSTDRRNRTRQFLSKEALLSGYKAIYEFAGGQ